MEERNLIQAEIVANTLNSVWASDKSSKAGTGL